MINPLREQVDLQVPSISVGTPALGFSFPFFSSACRLGVLRVMYAMCLFFGNWGKVSETKQLEMEPGS